MQPKPRPRLIHHNPVAADIDEAMHRLRDRCTDPVTLHLSTPATIALTALNRLYRLGQSDKAGEARERLAELRRSVSFHDVRDVIDTLTYYVERDFDREIKQQAGRVR